MKTAHSMKEGHFDKEIVPVTIPVRRGDPTVVSKDEHPKPGSTIEGLAKLRPAFKNVSFKSLVKIYLEIIFLAFLSLER